MSTTPLRLVLSIYALSVVSCSGTVRESLSPTTAPATSDLVREYIYCSENEAEIVTTATLMVDGRQLDQRVYPLKPVPEDVWEKIVSVAPDGSMVLNLGEGFPIENGLACGDGISPKTGRGIGFGSSIMIQNWRIPSNATTRSVNGRSPARLSIFAYWKDDDGRGSVKADVVVPVGQRSECRLTPNATLIAEFRAPRR